MAKATSVKTELSDVATKPCCECGKTLQAPWGRVEGGKKWVCSSGCNKLYQYRQQGIDNNVATVHRLTAMS